MLIKKSWKKTFEAVSAKKGRAGSGRRFRPLFGQAERAEKARRAGRLEGGGERP